MFLNLHLSKGHILKQGRLIKKLCKSLRLAKKFHNDLISVLDLFKDISLKYSDRIEEILETQGSFKKVVGAGSNRVFPDDNFYKTFDEQSKFKSIDIALCSYDTQDSFNTFLKNFNEAFEMVIIALILRIILVI